MYSNFLLQLVFLIKFSFCWSPNLNGLLKPRGVLGSSLSFDPNLVQSVSAGAQNAILHCKEAFKWDQWNCPDSTFTSKSKSLGITKEKSFVYAIVSAGIVHRITRSCAKGEIKGCGCDDNKKRPKLKIPLEQSTENGKLFDDRRKSPESDWYWGGCSENTTFAEGIVQKIFEDDEKGSDIQAHVITHNQKMGREIVRETMMRKCRCCGITGSCAIQSCWMEMRSFGEITAMLREKYDKARKITFDETVFDLSIGNGVVYKLDSRATKVMSEKLVYLDDSPSYCKADNNTGLEGTQGRLCSRLKGPNVSREQRTSCRRLCKQCGYRVKKEEKTVSNRCRCKFNWCCNVTCDVCEETIWELSCINKK